MRRFILILLTILLLPGCVPTGEPPAVSSAEPPPSSPPAETAPAPFEWTPKNFPGLDGSTATIPLGQGCLMTR